MKTTSVPFSLCLIALAGLMVFQNCSKVDFSGASPSKVNGSGNPSGTNNGNGSIPPGGSGSGHLDVCGGVSCSLDPLTTKPAVTTILLALGDESNSQLVVQGASSQLIAENVIRYSTPKAQPRILLVRDYNNAGEDPEDTLYVKNTLLARYNVTYINEPASGLTDADLAGYDLVWFNNPGHPMGSIATRDALLRFSGGVVLQGDDLSWGEKFSLESLTGLKHIDNGTSVECDGKSYAHDDNNGEKYRVTLDPSKMPGADSSTISFRYGNDIDNTSVSRPGLEVLASAVGGPSVCTQQRPTIVRYIKQ